MGDFVRQQVQIHLPPDHPLNRGANSGLESYSEDTEFGGPVVMAKGSITLDAPGSQRGEWSDLPKENVYERDPSPTRFGDANGQPMNYQQPHLDGAIRSVGTNSATERASGPSPTSSYNTSNPNQLRSIRDPYVPPPPSLEPAQETEKDLVESRLSAAESNRRARLARQHPNLNRRVE